MGGLQTSFQRVLVLQLSMLLPLPPARSWPARGKSSNLASSFCLLHLLFKKPTLHSPVQCTGKQAKNWSEKHQPP